MVIVYSMTRIAGGQDVALALAKEVSEALESNDETLQTASLLVASSLGLRAPDSVVASLLKVVSRHDLSNRVTIGAASTLLSIRPASIEAQRALNEEIDDASIPKSSRIGIIEAVSATMKDNTGAVHVQHLQQIIRNEGDKEIRDAAVRAIVQIGPSAVLDIKSSLIHIVQDSSESVSSREVAGKALASTGQY